MLNARLTHPRVSIESDTQVRAREILDRALDRFSHFIEEVTVTIKDTNGPKGGVDKECRLRLRLTSGLNAIATGRGSSITEAVHAASYRIKQVIVKRVEKIKRGPAKSIKKFQLPDEA